jgi:hypothetical protein
MVAVRLWRSSWRASTTELPVDARLCGGRTLQLHEVLDDAPDLLAAEVADVLARVLDLLGKMRQVERQVRTGGGESATLRLVEVSGTKSSS